MSWIFNGAGSFEKLPVQEDGPRTCHSERSEESQNECAEAKHIKIQDFSCLTTFHCNSIFALLLSFPKSLNFLLSPQTLPVSRPVIPTERSDEGSQKKTQMIEILRLLIMTDSRFYRVKYRIHVILSVCSQPFLGLLTAGSSSFTVEVFCQALVTFYYAAMVIAVGQI